MEKQNYHLNLLPNKSKLIKVMNQINAGEEELESDDDILYKFDKLLNKGIDELMRKLKIKDYDVDMEDDGFVLHLDNLDKNRLRYFQSLDLKINFQDTKKR